MGSLFNFGVFRPSLIRFGLGANFGLKRTWNKLEITKALCRPYITQWLTHGQPYVALSLSLFLSLSLLLPSSCFCPTPAVLLPCSLQTPILHIPGFSPVPALFLPALLHYSQLCSCPDSALLLPCSWSCPVGTPVWQPSSSSSAPYAFFRHGESRLLW